MLSRLQLLFLVQLIASGGGAKILNGRDRYYSSPDHGVYSGEVTLPGVGAWDASDRLLGIDIDVILVGDRLSPDAYGDARALRVSLIYKVPRIAPRGAAARASAAQPPAGVIAAACAVLRSATPWLADTAACQTTNGAKTRSVAPWELALGGGGALVHGGALRRDGTLGSTAGSQPYSSGDGEAFMHAASRGDMLQRAVGGSGTWRWGGGLLDEAFAAHGDAGSADEDAGGALSSYFVGIASSSADVAAMPNATPVIGDCGGLFFASSMSALSGPTGPLESYISRRSLAWRRKSDAASSARSWRSLGLHLSFSRGAQANETRVSFFETAARTSPSDANPNLDPPPEHGTLYVFTPKKDQAAGLSCAVYTKRGGRTVQKGPAACAAFDDGAGNATLLDLWLRSPHSPNGELTSALKPPSVIKAIQFSRESVGAGLSRQLHVAATVALAVTTNCSVALALDLPRSLYADLDQLRAGAAAEGKSTTGSFLWSFVPFIDIESPAAASADAVLFFAAHVVDAGAAAQPSRSSNDAALSPGAWSLRAAWDAVSDSSLLSITASIPFNVRYEAPGCSAAAGDEARAPQRWLAAATAANKSVRVLSDGYLRVADAVRSGCFVPLFLPMPSAHVKCGVGGAWTRVVAPSSAWPGAPNHDAARAPPLNLTPVGEAAGARRARSLAIAVYMCGTLAMLTAALMAVWTKDGGPREAAAPRAAKMRTSKMPSSRSSSAQPRRSRSTTARRRRERVEI